MTDLKIADWSDEDLVKLGKAVVESMNSGTPSWAITGDETEDDWKNAWNSVRGNALLVVLDSMGFSVSRRPGTQPVAFHKIGPKGELP